MRIVNKLGKLKTYTTVVELNSTEIDECLKRLVNENDLDVRWWLHQRIRLNREENDRLTKMIEVLNGKD